MVVPFGSKSGNCVFQHVKTCETGEPDVSAHVVTADDVRVAGELGALLD